MLLHILASDDVEEGALSYQRAAHIHQNSFEQQKRFGCAHGLILPQVYCVLRRHIRVGVDEYSGAIV